LHFVQDAKVTSRCRHGDLMWLTRDEARSRLMLAESVGRLHTFGRDDAIFQQFRIRPVLTGALILVAAATLAQYETLDHARQLLNGRAPIQFDGRARSEKRLYRLDIAQDFGLLL
ncbi:MAG TPA: hypothetical protein VFY56_00015, partial [Propionibacteriaceae bacterium]|nr:hypothetical protein [Propionibacteriaceae bacterium]